MGHIKHGNTIANEHRKKAASLPFRLAGYVTGNTGVNWVKSMTDVERHAELVYAESLFEKVKHSGASLSLANNPSLIIGVADRRLCWGLFIPVTGSHLSRKRTAIFSLL
jgi:hypothetical protein